MAFGDFYQDAEDLTQSVNNTVNFQEKVKLTTPNVIAGDYRVGWSYTWGHSSTANDFRAQIDQDDGTILYNHQQEPKDNAATQQQPGGGFAQITLTAGIHTFDLDFATSNAPNEARIAQARLEFWSVT